MADFASSAARKLATEHGVDAAALTGTGRAGRLTLADIKSAAPDPPPDDLGDAGAKLWRSIITDLATGWRLDQRELHLLHEAGRCADAIDALEQAVRCDGVTTTGSKGQTVAHPCLAEVNRIRQTQLKLLAAIELEDPRGPR